MIHKMRLNNEPFINIKNGTKTIELRLLDEKRRLINIGDIIIFENRKDNETIEVQVINLYKFKTFKELYSNFNKIALGYKANEETIPEDMEKYYSKEEQEQFGVVGIEVKLN